MTVLIAIPFYGVSGELIDKAVRHALAQSHQDTVVLVAGDGAPPPVSVRHDRLVLGTFARNCGTPMTQQAMILGSPFQWYAPMGADDFISRVHIDSLLNLRHPAAGSSVVWLHEGERQWLSKSPRTYIEFGCFHTDLLRAVGGYNSAEPFGQDSVLISVLVRTSHVALTHQPTYHKLIRADSLTHAADTKHGSPRRAAVKVRNHAALARCEAIGWRNVAAIREYRESLVPPALRFELEDRAAEVAKWLS